MIKLKNISLLFIKIKTRKQTYMFCGFAVALSTNSKPTKRAFCIGSYIPLRGWFPMRGFFHLFYLLCLAFVDAVVLVCRPRRSPVINLLSRFTARINAQQIRVTRYNPCSARCTVGRNCIKSTRRVLGHSLLCSVFCSHRSLIRLIRTARFARALRCAPLRSFVHSLAHSGAHG